MCLVTAYGNGDFAVASVLLSVLASDWLLSTQLAQLDPQLCL
jgi:hypothetical protein